MEGKKYLDYDLLSRYRSNSFYQNRDVLSRDKTYHVVAPKAPKMDENKHILHIPSLFTQPIAAHVPHIPADLSHPAVLQIHDNPAQIFGPQVPSTTTKVTNKPPEDSQPQSNNIPAFKEPPALPKIVDSQLNQDNHKSEFQPPSIYKLPGSENSHPAATPKATLSDTLTCPQGDLVQYWKKPTASDLSYQSPYFDPKESIKYVTFEPG